MNKLCCLMGILRKPITKLCLHCLPTLESSSSPYSFLWQGNRTSVSQCGINICKSLLNMLNLPYSQYLTRLATNKENYTIQICQCTLVALLKFLFSILHQLQCPSILSMQLNTECKRIICKEQWRKKKTMYIKGNNSFFLNMFSSCLTLIFGLYMNSQKTEVCIEQSVQTLS